MINVCIQSTSKFKMGLLITTLHCRRFVQQTFRHFTKAGSCAVGCSHLLFIALVWHSSGTQLYKQLLLVTIRITNRCDFLYYVFISFFSSFPYMFRALTL